MGAFSGMPDLRRDAVSGGGSHFIAAKITEAVGAHALSALAAFAFGFTGFLPTLLTALAGNAWLVFAFRCHPLLIGCPEFLLQ
jgi:fatty acid desaturase